MGALPVCSYISTKYNIPMIMVRNENKNYGTSKQIEGNYNRKNKCIIIEDVITTGKSSLECSKIVKNNSATIVGYACLIDRSNGKSAIKEKIVSQVKIDIPTYTENNLPKNLLTLKAVKPGSRNL